MVDGSDTGKGGSDLGRTSVSVTSPDAKSWFVREILPLEGLLMHLLNRYLRNPTDAADARQDVYVKVYEAARRQLPDAPKQFLVATARNLVIDRMRHKQVISIETAGDLERFTIPSDEPGPERTAEARSELGRLRRILDRLPPRCREAMILRKIEGLPRREIASRMGISETAVAQHLSVGMRVLADELDALDTRSEP
jgi:RNA polymerase sigma factor (sigma-70 family)